MVAGRGIEPRLTNSKFAFLPLEDPAMDAGMGFEPMSSYSE